MKSIILVSCVVFFTIASQAIGVWYWPPSDVQIEPQSPTSSDIVNITLSGQWGNSCVPNDSYVSVEGNDIYFGVISDTSGYCLQVVTPWQLTESVGPLSPGTYHIYVSLDSGPWTLMTEFNIGEIFWIPGEIPPPNGWQISPPDPNITDLIDFSCAIRNGEIYGNSCYAEQAMGGTPTITINAISKNIELRFEPPAPEICLAVFILVSGLEGSFGPLEAGEWNLLAYFPGDIRMDSFHVFIPGDIDGDDDVDFVDFADFAARWRDSGCGVCGAADFGGDGNVGEDDLRIFADNWLW